MKRTLLFTLIFLLGLLGIAEAQYTNRPFSSLIPCGNGETITYNTSTSSWDTCAGFAGGGDMLSSAYTTAGKIKAAAGGTGIDTATGTPSGTPYVTNGVWALTSAANMRTTLGLVIGTNVLAPDGSAASLTSFPTLNQDTIGMSGSIKSPATTGKVTITGPGTGTTRVKTVRDANDTVLELGGSYTPSGTWDWGTAIVTWPAAALKTQLSIGNVENTALSTWAGSGNITGTGTITSGVWNGTAIGAAYLPSSSATGAGIVASGASKVNKVWKTDAGGVPDWRDDSTGGTPTFDTVGSGTNVSSTMTVGAGGTLTYSTTGVNNASQFRGVTAVDATEFGYLDGVTSAIQTQLNAKANTAAPTFTGDITATTFHGNVAGNVTGAVTGNASTATAMAANGANCPAGQFPTGVDASGAAEGCTTVAANITGTTNQITVTGSSSVTLSIPTNPTLPGTTTGTFSGNLTGNVTGNASGTAGGLSGTPALPNGTTATTQTAGDNSTKLATTAYANAIVSDTAYNAGTWDAVTAIAASKNAVRDEIELRATKSNAAFSGTFTFPTGLTGVIRADSGVASVDSDVTDIVAAGTTAAAGKLQLATNAQTTTGTSTSLVVTPDDLAYLFARPFAIGSTTPAAITGTTVTAGAGGFTVDADGDVIAKSLTVPKTVDTPSQSLLYSSYSTQTTGAGWQGPSSAAGMANSYYLGLPETEPTEGQLLVAGSPSNHIIPMLWGTSVTGVIADQGITLMAGQVGLTPCSDDGYLYKWNVSTSKWVCSADNNSGTPALNAVTNPTIAKTFTLVDNNASGLSFGSTGKADILKVITTDNGEGVGMSGTLGVVGNINNTTLNINSIVTTDASKNLTSLAPGTGVTTALAANVNGTGGFVTVGNASGNGAVLTGYTKGAGTVAATDTLLQAVQKLDGNDDAKLSTTSPGVIDGSADFTLTAAQMSDPRCQVTNYNMSAADHVVNLPTAAAGLSCLFDVVTARSNKWGVRAGSTDLIYLIAADGTIAKGSDNGYARMTAAQDGQSFGCWSHKTGASSYDWKCKAAAIGTSTFAAN